MPRPRTWLDRSVHSVRTSRTPASRASRNTMSDDAALLFRKSLEPDDVELSSRMCLLARLAPRRTDRTQHRGYASGRGELHSKHK